MVSVVDNGFYDYEAAEESFGYWDGGCGLRVGVVFVEAVAGS